MKKCMDGNSACAHVAYACSEVACIYPITPSSTMAELCDEWSSGGRKNIFGKPLKVVEMQSEAGAAGALHGSLCGGALSTTFTASQGLLLMLPNMYKIAGELLPAVFHVSARALATHALSIFGDHQDVMAVRQSGFCMLCSANVQECMDFALVSHIASLGASLPFLHFFDGFRTSHEIQKIDVIDYEDIKKVININYVKDFKKLALDPKNPHQRGTAQNPDVYFQNREAANPFYQCSLDEIKDAFGDIENLTGRKYAPFMYFGDKSAERVIVVMGSAGETIKEVVADLNKTGEKVGVISVKLYRPFDSKSFAKALPKTCKAVAVLDRTKDPAAPLEPLHQDVISALFKENRKNIKVVGGRYGLGGKEFTPKHAYAVFKNLKSKKIKDNFTVGIIDDVTNTSLEISDYAIKNNCKEIRFYGLGSDGTVSASKNAIKIIGDNTNKNVQGYFEYDSKKSGSMTISHLRFSNNDIKSAYLTTNCDLISISSINFLEKCDLLRDLKDGGTVLLNTNFNAEKLSEVLPKDVCAALKEKHAKLFTIPADELANKHNLGGKINTIMQTAFFKLTNILDFNFAKQKMREAIISSYSKKGQKVVDENCALIDVAEKNITKIDTNKLVGRQRDICDKKTPFYEQVIKPASVRDGDNIPVSCFSPDGAVQTNTSMFEKRGIAANIPCYISKNCIECGRCVAACPHGALSTILTDTKNLKNCPNEFDTRESIGQPGKSFRIQVSPLDCTGCGVCSKVCPVREKALIMTDMQTSLKVEKECYDYSLSLPESESIFRADTIKGLQFKEPYFKFNGACAGCGETPYIKMLTQLFGDKLIIANATGCSSIYGGSFPICPYSKDKNGCGPAWANSLFEDNAEFGMGIKIAREMQDKNDSVWIIGGDGWAYDIGYGGLDHVLSTKEKVRVLILDTEVYSNTGGQASKSSQRGQVAKFAASGKSCKKKDLFSILMASENCYVASVSLGYDMNQTLRAFIEAENYDGPSVIIAYAPCINHGINMQDSEEEMNKAVQSGYFTTARFNPKSETKLIIDSGEPTLDFEEFLMGENRYRSLASKDAAAAKELFEQSHKDAIARREKLKKYNQNHSE